MEDGQTITLSGGTGLAHFGIHAQDGPDDVQTFNFIKGDMENDTLIYGSATKDLLVGGLGSDLVSGGGGDDALFGDGDAIYAGAGNDFISNGFSLTGTSYN